MASVGKAHIGPRGLLNANPVALQRIKRLGVKAALLALHHAPKIHYTQTPARWEGIAQHLRSYKGQYPKQCDCSSFATWVLWDATRAYSAARRTDFVNGQGWKAGHTGSLVTKGHEVSLNELRILDLVFYGDEGWRPKHVAVYVGAGKVVSHGSEAGPFLLPVRYRSDVAAGGFGPRRYVH